MQRRELAWICKSTDRRRAYLIMRLAFIALRHYLCLGDVFSKEFVARAAPVRNEAAGLLVD
eukprot:11224495-Lingulodinium_polyedra.AAC.1